MNSIAATLGKSVVRATTSCGSCIRKAPNLRQLIFELPPATNIPPEPSNGERSPCRNVTLQNSSPRSRLEGRCRSYAMQKRRMFLGKYKHQAIPSIRTAGADHRFYRHPAPVWIASNCGSCYIGVCSVICLRVPIRSPQRTAAFT